LLLRKEVKRITNQSWANPNKKESIVAMNEAASNHAEEELQNNTNDEASAHGRRPGGLPIADDTVEEGK
jgi:hypothetical protein